MEEGSSVHKTLIVKPIRNIHLGRPKSRWEDTIKIDLK